MRVFPFSTSEILVVCFVFLSACSSSQLTVESDPAGAEVFTVNSGNMKQKIGVTPMTLTPSVNPNAFLPDTQIQVNKSGYRSESFLIPSQASGSFGRLQARLTEDPVSKSCQDSANSLTEATDVVAQVQHMIFKKNYTDAERTLNTYTVKYPAIPVFHTLLGNVYYLEKNLDKALDAYQRSTALQPQNQEASRMIQKIKSIRGGGA